MDIRFGEVLVVPWDSLVIPIHYVVLLSLVERRIFRASMPVQFADK